MQPNNTYTYQLAGEPSKAMGSQRGSEQAAGALPIDSPERRRLPVLLRHAWYGLNQAFRRAIAKTGVTPDQFTVMRVVLEGDPKGMTQRQLTQAMSSDPNTVASLLERMVRSGWIERRPHETDRRAYRIRVTPEGKRRYRELRAIAVNLQSEILEALPPERRERFLDDLNAIADACRQAAVNRDGKDGRSHSQ